MDTCLKPYPEVMHAGRSFTLIFRMKNLNVAQWILSEKAAQEKRNQLAGYLPCFVEIQCSTMRLYIGFQSIRR
ncbi:MAG: hypothetical protein ABIK28_05835 [Planctomycetota bacterium]